MPTSVNNKPPSKSNPWDALGDNEYAGNVAPTRADQSTVGGAAGSYYPDSNEQGNEVKPQAINKTKDTVSRSGSQAFPGGTSAGSGY
jgi:hypothetical protein